ncbi:putative odorant-binding protein A10 [Leptopilina boulardi]|uniref:putative odorant-binding protein A10 n=1 Tax=Leptopilina boulardi TaxID=63433 RepID=UPI0021F53B43|nr:putative odorant-binding protein A10 [Leptopilina boulardi]
MFAPRSFQDKNPGTFSLINSSVKMENRLFQVLLMIIILIITINANTNDYSDLLDNEEFRINLIKCIYEDKPCKPPMDRIKIMVVNAILNICPDCTAFEKEQGKKIMSYLKIHHPLEWILVDDRYIY